METGPDKKQPNRRISLCDDTAHFLENRIRHHVVISLGLHSALHYLQGPIFHELVMPSGSTSHHS